MKKRTPAIHLFLITNVLKEARGNQTNVCGRVVAVSVGVCFKSIFNGDAHAYYHPPPKEKVNTVFASLSLCLFVLQIFSWMDFLIKLTKPKFWADNYWLTSTTD